MLPLLSAGLPAHAVAPSRNHLADNSLDWDTVEIGCLGLNVMVLGGMTLALTKHSTEFAVAGVVNSVPIDLDAAGVAVVFAEAAVAGAAVVVDIGSVAAMKSS